MQQIPTTWLKVRILGPQMITAQFSKAKIITYLKLKIFKYLPINCFYKAEN